MEEPEHNLSTDNFCHSCLNKNDERTLKVHKMQNGFLKSVFQLESITLCYVCKRIAQHAESFIENVQSNQLLLENYQNITSITLQALKSQIQPYSLSHKSLDVIELGNDCEMDGDETFNDSFIVYGTNRDIEIKIELKDEDENDDLDMDFADHDVGMNIKEEDEEEYPLKRLKEELELEGIKIKCLRKSTKKGKVKKKNAVKVKEEPLEKDYFDQKKVETIHITYEQCMAERARAAKEEKYMNSVYKCEDCIKGFNFKVSYDKHMEKHSELNGNYECDICKQRLPSDVKLQEHRRYHMLRYKCGECKLTRVTKLTIQDHYTAYHSHGYHQYNCSLCAKTFKRKVSLRKHILYVHRTKERAQCAYCSKNYASKEVLKTHLILKHPNEVSAGDIPKRHACPECRMSFSSPSHLRNHSIKHSTRRDYYCVECDKSFKSDSILKNHLKTALPHVNYIELPLPCQHCEKRFSVKRDLARHTNRVHLNIKPFRCDKCDKAYINLWSLNEHKRLIHEGYKRPLKYPCPFCEKVFDRNQILKAHIRTHTGERPYQCSKCPAQFSQASVLRTHVKLIHLKLTRDGRPKASVDIK